MKVLCIITLTFCLLSLVSIFPSQEVFAAEVVIDGTASTTSTSVKNRPALVFISNSVGYMFYRDSGGTCVYSKTSDGGSSWSAATNFTAQTDCLMLAVWYDQWTPGNTGTLIHIAFNDTGSDDVWYDTLNTTGDVNGTEVAIDTSAGNTYGGPDNITITRGTDGDLYTGFCDGSAATACNIKKCTATCTTAGNWVQSGLATPLDVANDYIRLMPLTNGNIMVIRDDISADAIQSKVYTDSTNLWDITWTTILSSVTESATYPGTLAATLDRTTNDIYVAVVASVAGAGTADVRTAVYNGSWTTKTDVVTNQNTIIATDIAVDELSKDVYVAYLSGTAGSNTTAFYKKSLDTMTSWGPATQFNTTTGDLRFVYLNMASTDLLYGSYYTNTASNDALYGNTITTISPTNPSWSIGSTNFKIFQSGSLSWGAGTEVCSGNLSDDNAATISCSGTGLSDSTQYRVDVTLKNTGGTTIKMNGSGDFIDHIAVKNGWGGTSPTLGSCGFNDVEADNGSSSCNLTFSGDDIRMTNTGAGNINIKAGETEGFMYLITTDTNVPTSNSTSYMNTTIDGVSEDSSKITIPKVAVISISVTDGNITYGTLAPNSSRNTTNNQLNDTQVVTNDSTVAIDLNIRGQNTSCPWTLSGTAGNDMYAHAFCTTGSGSPDPCDTSPTWNYLTTSNQSLESNIAAGLSSRFDLNLTSPTITSCYDQQSVDVTIQATQH